MIDRDTVIALAKKSGAIFDGSNWQLTCDFEHNELLAFAQAVAQKAVEGEREACAALCEVVGQRPEWFEAEDCAIAIRNRGIGGGK